MFAAQSDGQSNPWYIFGLLPCCNLLCLPVLSEKVDNVKRRSIHQPDCEMKGCLPLFLKFKKIKHLHKPPWEYEALAENRRAGKKKKKKLQQHIMNRKSNAMQKKSFNVTS